MIDIDPRLGELHPGARVGALRLRTRANDYRNESLEEARLGLEAELRGKFASFSRKDLLALPIVSVYAAYYQNFGKTYHLLLQLESIVFKQKGIPAVSPLVQAMFMAEMKNMILTAAHDREKLEGRVRLRTGLPADRYVAFGGAKKSVSPGDLMIEDERGVISSIVNGPDMRTALGSSTTDVLYTAYAPEGIADGAVESHLADIAAYLRMHDADCVVEESGIFG